MKEVKVVAGLYLRDGRALVLKRSSDPELAKGFPDLWELPGGKPEKDESPFQTLVREWFQELGVVVIQIGMQISTTVLERADMRVTVCLFEVLGFVCDPRPCEAMHDEVGWFDHDRITALTAAEAPGIHGMREDVLRYIDSRSPRRSP